MIAESARLNMKDAKDYMLRISSPVFALAAVLFIGMSVSAYAEDQQKAQGLDMVSDTVATAFNKANALLAGNLDITMSPDNTDTEEQFTTNAIGQKVPKTTAIKSAGSLHSDQPL